MEPTQELIDALYREELEAARGMSPEEKLLAGPRLFEMSCRIVKDGIRHQHPETTEKDVQRMLEHRLSSARRLEQEP